LKPMLASKWDEAKNSQMFPYWAQPKLDGIRTLVGEDGYLYTRSLKPVRNEELQSMVRNNRHLLKGMDAEVIVGDPTAPDCYRRTSSAVMSYNNPDIAAASLWLFDIWNHKGTYDNRYGELLSRVATFPSWVRVTSCSLISDMEMLQEYQAKRLAEGHEGVILRRRDQLYKKGRGTPTKGELIKVKKWADDEGEIVAVHEELHNANPATYNNLGHMEHSGHKENLIGKGRLGAIEVKLGEKWPSEVVRVGTGFDAAQRESLWKNREDLIGKIAKYKYFEIGVKDAPRFPVFLGFRDPDDMDQPTLF